MNLPIAVAGNHLLRGILPLRTDWLQFCRMLHQSFVRILALVYHGDTSTLPNTHKKRLMTTAQPWKPADATRVINTTAKGLNCTLALTMHAKAQMHDRQLIMSDVLFVLRNGFVYEAPVPSTIAGFFKYKIECQSPNSGSRYLRAIVVPDEKSRQIKVITIMWRDEDS
jgi:hypothetical protein